MKNNKLETWEINDTIVFTFLSFAIIACIGLFIALCINIEIGERVCLIPIIGTALTALIGHIINFFN